MRFGTPRRPLPSPHRYSAAYGEYMLFWQSRRPDVAHLPGSPVGCPPRQWVIAGHRRVTRARHNAPETQPNLTQSNPTQPNPTFFLTKKYLLTTPLTFLRAVEWDLHPLETLRVSLPRCLSEKQGLAFSILPAPCASLMLYLVGDGGPSIYRCFAIAPSLPYNWGEFFILPGEGGHHLSLASPYREGQMSPREYFRAGPHPPPRAMEEDFVLVITSRSGASRLTLTLRDWRENIHREQEARRN